METIGAAAFFAIEMYMLVVEGVVALACAKFVFERTASVFYGMYQIFFEQEVERAEYGAAVCRNHAFLQLLQADGMVTLFQHAIYKDAHGGGLYPLVLQMLLNFGMFHISI